MTTEAVRSIFTVGMITDIVIIAIIIINIITGAKNGFLYTVYRFLRVIIAVVAACFFARPLADLIKTTPAYNSLAKNLESSLGNYIDDVVSGFFTGGADSMTEKMQASESGLVSLLEAFGRSPEEIAAEYSRLMEQKAETAAEELKQFIIAPVTDAITMAISFIMIFIVSLLVLYIIMSVLNLVADAPVVNFINRILGGAAGAVFAIIHIFIISILLDAILPLTGSVGVDILAQIKESSLYSLVFSFNPIAFLVAMAL